jgi:hypothetical protein
VSHDPARVLRDHVLEPLRAALGARGARLLVVLDAAAAGGLAEAGTEYDAAWVGLERTDGVDVERLGRDLGHALRPGAPLACVVRGAWPLPATLARALRGTGDVPGVMRARVEGRPSERVSLGAWRHSLAPWFIEQRVRAFGVLVPPAAAWEALHPLILDVLAAAEQVVAGWPVARALGERVLVEAVRR